MDAKPGQYNLVFDNFAPINSDADDITVGMTITGVTTGAGSISSLGGATITVQALLNISY